MKRLIIECGAVQTRAALLKEDAVWKFWFGPARGDEAGDMFPMAGRRFAARVKVIDKSLGAVFADLGEGYEAFLPLKKNSELHCVEGAMIEVEVKAPPRQSKGALLRFVAPLSNDAQPGRIGPFLDPAVEAVKTLGAEADEILIDDGVTMKALKQEGFDQARHETRPISLFERYGADGEFEAAFNRVVELSGGGRLIINEAQALCAIDVDTAGLGAASPARLREKIAFAAADEALRQISLRNIGGHAVIDFPDMPGEGARKRFQEHLKKRLAQLDGAGAASFSRSGLYSFTLPHRERSLLGRFTETDETAPVSGRRFTVNAQAVFALTALEGRLRAAPSARLRLRVAHAIKAKIDAQLRWTERLKERYGARFEIIEDKECEGRGFDLSEQ